MSDVPFGFGDRDDDPAEGGRKPGGGQGDPFAQLFGMGGAAGFPGGPGSPDLGAMMSQLGKVLSWTGGPVNWDLCRDLARSSPAVSNDRYLGESDRTTVIEALRLAELWLDAETALPQGATRSVAWSRGDWVEQTLPAWKPLVEPIADRVVTSLTEVLAAQAPPELSAMMGSLDPMMRTFGGAMFGGQIGQALGTLAEEVFGSTDVGLPLGPAGVAVLLPANVAAFGEGLGVPLDEVRLYLALREAACHRLYTSAGWLRSRVESDLLRYARGITLDMARLEEAAAQLDPGSLGDPEGMQEVLLGDLFSPQHTPEQTAVLERLETLLALVEGWIDAVVTAAAEPHLPAATALQEAMRRRRATGGPAEQTFASLVGLELRPRRLREAAALWQAVTEARGIEGRDAIWEHPDYLPDAEQFADPAAFLTQEPTFDIAELTDARPADVRPADAGPTDTEPTDAGPTDAGPTDGPDEGPGDAPPATKDPEP